MKLVQATLAACVGSVAIASAASATSTVATFSDPASGPGTPLFTFNAAAGTLTGGWGASGLLLETPGLPLVPNFADATFTMTPLSAMSSGPIYLMGGGMINFFDSTNAPLMTITFTSAILTSSLGLGASDFSGFNVTFSGPILAGFGSVTNESFSFSFANPAQLATAPGFTVTSSFTSSAELVPAPGAAALLGLGGLLAARRRR
jgi:MYXO-CTERM domain-containing protein